MTLNFLANGLVIAGACVLIGALIPVYRLIAQRLSAQVRRKWYVMTGLIALLIVAYISYAVSSWGHPVTRSDLIVPGIFLFGAVVVWLITALSLQTAADVRRLTILEQENINDPLIGIYNRRYLDRRLAEECAMAHRYRLPLSVLLVDIDQFKSINDKYGRPVGDLLLRDLGKLLLQTIREADIAARYDRDEVLIITPNTTPTFAAVLAERIRRRVEAHEFGLTNRSSQPLGIRITISIGVAGLDQKTYNRQSLLNDVDEALFRAKQEGRNRAVIYGVDQPKPASPVV